MRLASLFRIWVCENLHPDQSPVPEIGTHRLLSRSKLWRLGLYRDLSPQHQSCLCEQVGFASGIRDQRCKDLPVGATICKSSQACKQSMYSRRKEVHEIKRKSPWPSVAGLQLRLAAWVCVGIGMKRQHFLEQLLQTGFEQILQPVGQSQELKSKRKQNNTELP